MRIEFTFEKKEGRAIELLRDGLNPVLSKLDMAGIVTEAKRESDGNLKVVINMDPGYAAKILKAYAEFLPAIAANVLSLATTLRGMSLRFVDIEKEEREERERLSKFSKDNVAA